MVSTLKERPNGGFYCSECRMSTADLVDVCPFCGSIITNWMDIIVQYENEKFKMKVKENEDNIHGRD